MTGAPAIQRAADRVVEACCLIAVLSLPLYFTVLTNTGYEPDKALLLRVFATVACGAWLVGFLAGPRTDLGFLRRNWLLYLSVGVFLAYAIATVLSIEPTLSLWGSNGRQEGLWTRAAYVVFFVAALTTLRTRDQWNRLVTVLLFGSIPVVAYGIIQQFALDPIPNAGDPSSLQFSVRSTLGQHVFLGSYLVMVIPFAAARVLENRDWTSAPLKRRNGDEALLVGAAIGFALMSFFAFAALGYHRPALFSLLPALLAGYALLGVAIEELPDSVPVRRMRFVLYSLVLVALLVTLALTGARGAWLGFFASVPIFGFLLARRLRLVQLSRAVLAASLAIGLFVAVLNVPNGPLQPLRTMRGLNRLAGIAESAGGGGSGQGRLFIWEGVTNLMRQHPAIGSSWGGIGRDLVGYGPETLHDSFQAVFPLQLRVATSEIWVWDRAHNIFLDVLADAGFLGLLTTLLVLALVFWRATQLADGVEGTNALLLIGAASALGGHLVDGLFGLETSVTLLLLWLIVAMFAGLPWRAPETEAEVATAATRPALLYWAALLVLLALLALVPSAANYPAFLGAFWIAGAAAGVGAVAWALTPGTKAEEPAPVNQRRQKRGKAAQTSPRQQAAPPRRLPLAGIAVVALLTAIMLDSQMQSQTAATAERTGLTNFNLHKDSDTIAYLQQAARADAHQAVYRMQLGGEYETLAASHAVSADPGYAPSAGDIASIDPQQVLLLGRDQLYQLATDSLQAARAIAPYDPDAYNNLGNLYMKWNKPMLALAMYRRAEQLSFQNPTYLDRSALALLQVQRTQEAYANARSALSLDDTYWYSHYTLALVEHTLGAHLQARQEAALALATVHNFWPPPPQSQLTQMQQVQREG